MQGRVVVWSAAEKGHVFPNGKVPEEANLFNTSEARSRAGSHCGGGARQVLSERELAKQSIARSLAILFY